MKARARSGIRVGLRPRLLIVWTACWGVPVALKLLGIL